MNAPAPRSGRIASIDWLRGFVMLLMVLDHVSMAYNAGHDGRDSAALYEPGTTWTPLAFLTRWVTHICAPVFVFLAGTALAISVERRVHRGVDARDIDVGMIKRGLFIAVLDPTLVSFFSGRWTFQVLFAIGMAMVCMAVLRRLPTLGLVLLGVGWFAAQDAITGLVWDPSDATPSLLSAFLGAQYSAADLVVKYPLVPWLAMMVLGWAFGRYVLARAQEPTRIVRGLVLGGAACLVVFLVVRGINDYGNAWLLRDDGSWMQWLHVSKYPPSLTFTALEFGLMAWLLALMMVLERRIGVRPNGVLLVFGQTAMFFYLVHRIVLEGSATWLGLRGCTGLGMTYVITVVLLAALYPLCRWYRALKKRHKGATWTSYL